MLSLEQPSLVCLEGAQLSYNVLLSKHNIEQIQVVDCHSKNVRMPWSLKWKRDEWHHHECARVWPRRSNHLFSEKNKSSKGGKKNSWRPSHFDPRSPGRDSSEKNHKLSMMRSLSLAHSLCADVKSSRKLPRPPSPLDSRLRALRLGLDSFSKKKKNGATCTPSGLRKPSFYFFFIVAFLSLLLIQLNSPCVYLIHFPA